MIPFEILWLKNSAWAEFVGVRNGGWLTRGFLPPASVWGCSTPVWTSHFGHGTAADVAQVIISGGFWLERGMNYASCSAAYVSLLPDFVLGHDLDLSPPMMES